MRIAVPRERKPLEGRVALVPAAVAELVAQGHELLVEAAAGEKSGYADSEYATAGARIVTQAPDLYEHAELVVKVKEPIPLEYPWLRAQHVLFSYLHLAANPKLADALTRIGLTALAFETVEIDGRLPLLAPMSHIAGRLAVQIGAHLLHTPQGGRGLLLGGLARAERGRVVILGAGAAGGEAAVVAAALGAEVTVFDRKSEALERMFAIGPNVTALTAYQASIADAVAQADILIGAVLIPGARAPHLVTRKMVQTMKRGAVILDIAIDQGGCVETIRPTDYTAPTYVDEGVVHFGVTNMPGAVPRTASQALSAAILPFVQRVAEQGPRDPLLHGGLNVADGRVVHPAVARALAKRA